MTSILNNVPALAASRQLNITQAGLQQTITRLTTGKRINRAADDAAGLAISNKLGADIRISAQGQRNAADGVSFLQVADGVLDEVTNLLTRAAELSQQAATGTVSDSNRAGIDAEFQNIIKTIADYGLNSKFNGQVIFNTATTVTVAVGGFSNVGVTISSIATSATTTLGLTLNTDNMLTATAASSAFTTITTALESVSNLRATLGASMQQLTSVSNALGIQVENFTAAFSHITDADIASEVVNLTKFQILTQSGTSALAQANNAQQQILALLR